MSEEYIVKGGTIADGSGGPLRQADVRVVDGVIAEIGEDLTGGTVLDAGGSIVAPGFIDIHTHYDAQVFWDPWLTPSSLQGVTTVVGGNCGLSLAPCHAESRESMVRTLEFVEDMDPDSLFQGVDWSWESFADYRRALEGKGLGINFGSYVGHTALRMWVLGAESYEREATPAEVEAMSRALVESLDAGAVGFSTDRSNFHKGDGGRAVPSTIGSDDEFLALMRTTASYDGGRRPCALITHESGEWIYPLQRSLGCPVTFCQIITYPEASPRHPLARQQLAVHRREMEKGSGVHPQVTPRPISFQVSLANPFPFFPAPAFGELAKVDVDGRRALYRDPEWRRRAAADMAAKSWVDPNWGKFSVAESPTQPELVGRSIEDIAAQRGADPTLVAIDIALADNLATRFQVIFANDDIPLLEEILRTPGCVLGLSDGGAHNSQICDAGLPLDFLARWVRERSLMPLEAGVRKLTGEFADLLGLDDRGYLAVGKAADVVVFDFDAVDPGPLRRVADLPGGADRLVADQPRGLRHLLVNGTPICLDGEDRRSALSRLPGGFLH